MTPRSMRRHQERNQRLLESPQNRRVPAPAFIPPPPFILPEQIAPVNQYPHLPAHLAQQLANLPPLQPVGRRGRQPAPVPIVS